MCGPQSTGGLWASSLRSSRFLSFHFPGEERTSGRKKRTSAWGQQKLGEKWGGGERGGRGGGEGVGRKGNACNQSQTLYRTPFAQERGAIVQFDWLVARQSKSDIKSLTFMHNRHPEYKATNKIQNMAESVEALEFSLQETLKDISKNSKQIDPNNGIYNTQHSQQTCA